MKNTNQGYAGVPRIALQLPIWSDPHELGLWLYCLLTASRKSFRGLKPGQFYTSKEKMAKALGWSKSTVYKSLTALQHKRMLQAISSKQGTIITVCYWAELTSCHPVPQHVLTALGAQEADAPADPILDILRQNGIEPITDDETDLPDQSEQRCPAKAANHPIAVPSRRTEEENSNERRKLGGFNLFWNAYPRKIDKTAAWHMYSEIDPDLERLMDALMVAKDSQAWMTESGRYIPSPAKWLDGAWENYAPPARREESEIWTSR